MRKLLLAMLLISGTAFAEAPKVGEEHVKPLWTLWYFSHHFSFKIADFFAPDAPEDKRIVAYDVCKAAQKAYVATTTATLERTACLPYNPLRCDQTQGGCEK